jgi:thioredoxin reductase (NADPH)
VTNDVQVVGDRWSDRTHELKTFLARNHVPYRWYDVERDDEGRRLFTLAGGLRSDLPLVLVPDRDPIRAPTLREAASALGLHVEAERPLYDVCIVGGGPAGLAAGVYAASEGLSTVIIEREAPGGQAGQSSSIENYLGFPRGLSGSDLAQRALAQVSRFGAELVLAREVVGLEERGTVRAVLFEGGGELEARSVVVSTGVTYRRLEAAGLQRLQGKGVYYGATAAEAGQTAGDLVYVIGGANSAGQAALNFARHAKHVTLVVRGRDLLATMSTYLVDRIVTTPNITIRHDTVVAAADGDDHLERLTLATRESDRREEVDASWLFVFIGASPRTDWLGDSVARDAHGFVLTGPEVVGSETPWGLARAPYALETSVPGVFAAGDVRQESMKRVASAVGEGAMSIYLVHRYLATV